MPYALSDGTRIFWEESGSGEPLLLIMGLGYSHEMWHRTRPVVSAHYRTILFDNRGVGKSDVPQGAYSIAQMAADAAAVLDTAGITKAHVFGMPMGGMIAQEFALNYPERVNRLVLGCTACGGRNAIPAAQNVLDVVMARAKMTPEAGAEAMVPYIYDRSTPVNGSKKIWRSGDAPIQKRQATWAKCKRYLHGLHSTGLGVLVCPR